MKKVGMLIVGGVKLIGALLLLLLVLGVIGNINTLAGIALGVVLAPVFLYAVFAPLPSVGRISPVIAIVLAVVSGMYSGGAYMQMQQAAKERRIALEQLRNEDPSAYLSQIKESDPNLWLTELEQLDPEAYRVEMARREQEAAEAAARQREQEERERLAEVARQEAERRAAEATAALERAQALAPNRITGAYVGCTTKAALDEFITAANNNDLRQIQALTGAACTSIEGLEYSIVDRGWMTSQIRVYGNGTSAVLWTVSEAIKSDR